MAQTLTDLIAALGSTEIPFAQIEFEDQTNPDMPYALLVPADTRNWFADGRVNESPVMYLVELYTRVREVAVERVIQDALDDAGIGWQRATVPVQDGRAIMTRWYAHVFER